MSMNPRETTDKIRRDYLDYLASILTVTDPQITALARKRIAETDFVKGPYLEPTLPFVEGARLKDLAEQGLISTEFERMGKSVHYEDWHLRIHQESALRKIITEKRNMVVSTGTGSGKTECYLYPVFDAIMREKEAGTLDPGVRALLIFPMNALANDQQKKLRKLLRNYPDITFGRYTGETPYKKKNETVLQAEERLHREYDQAHHGDSEPDLRRSLPNEFMCRDKMIETPPHILLTNYAMLEYLLLRPDTAPFFDNDSARHWRFIVIDEAHTYKGATGTEIAFLLRKLKERIRRVRADPFTCIATSATLGSEDGKADLAGFAEHLFGEPFSAEDVITTKRRDMIPPPDVRPFLPEDYRRLKEQTSTKEEFEKGSILTDALSKDLRLFSVYDVLRGRPKRIDEIADRVFADLPEKEERLSALVDLIELAAAAKKSEFEAALLPARYHLFIKSLEGMFVQFYPQKRVFLDRRELSVENGTAFSVFELANCQRCGQDYLIGKTEHAGPGARLVQTSSTEKPEYYFVSDQDALTLSAFDDDDDTEVTSNMGELDKYRLCLACGRITPFAENPAPDCCDVKDGRKIVTVYNLKYTGKSYESNCCPCCGATRKGLLKRFLTANQPATFAVAKSLYEAIPPRPQKTEEAGSAAGPDVSENSFFDDLFADETPADEVPQETDESGRKLLIFSDNRQEAAFFAGFFEQKYRLIMWRKVILQCLEEAENESLLMDDLITRVWQYADKHRLYSFDLENRSDLSDIQKKQIAARYVMQEFLTPDAATGLEGLGYIRIVPELPQLRADLNIAGAAGDDLRNLIRLLMDTLRQKGAVKYPDDIHASDEFFSPRNHSGYFRESGPEKNSQGYIYGFVPENNKQNKRLSVLLKLAGKSGLSGSEAESAARTNLITLYKLLLKLEDRGLIRKTTAGQAGTVYILNYAKWRVSRIKKTDRMYRCKKCGKVFDYSVGRICPSMKCDGELEPISAETAQDKPYYKGLFSCTKLIPMEAREHTAQLSSKTAGDYQKDFEEGRINVLSCSTTFEMGVDVGELEATFQRNVPPETANYIQRAGRAGRRTSSAAFSVTFARRSSHDMTFFQDPSKIIAGRISAPILEITNDKIARRHLNSIVVAWFFKQRPEYFRENTKRIVAEEDMATALRALLQKHPADLLERIHNTFPAEICAALGVDRWSFTDDITGPEGSLTRAIAERQSDLEGLRGFIENMDISSKKERAKAGAASDLITTLESEPSLSFLSSKSVLPKYGFPIDTVSLDILSGEKEEAKKIDLSRDLKQAISEFAPPAQVVANGKIWSSYAINTVPNKSWPTYIYYECPHCLRILPPEEGVKEVTADLQTAPKKNCTNCGTRMNARKFIVPLFGFSTNIDKKPKPVGDNKPGLYYSTQLQFWGIENRTQQQKAEAMEENADLCGKQILKVYSPGGKLFVLNQGTAGRGFLVCPLCGFTTDPVKKKPVRGHENKYSRKCTCSLAGVSLGHSFSTDILKISLPHCDASFPLTSGSEKHDRQLSILYAVIEGACSALEISREDINGCVDLSGDLILFDDTPGGSGFVKRIYASLEKVLREAKNKVSGKCGCSEETSCYGCLRTYSNQYFHDALSRGAAFRYLSWLLDENASHPAASDVKVPGTVLEKTGTHILSYTAPETAAEPDTLQALRTLRETTEDETEQYAIDVLYAAAERGRFEHPLMDRCLPASTDVWPELFWPASRVALFAPGDHAQYELMKQYNWYCYYLDDTLVPDTVLAHVIKKGD